jgi:hypothetical protein
MHRRTRGTLAAAAAMLLFSAPLVSAQSASGTAPNKMGQHSMDGEVTKVDPKKGWIDVKTSEGSMKLHFPPEALTNIKKGNRVTVDLGIKDNGPAAAK